VTEDPVAEDPAAEDPVDSAVAEAAVREAPAAAERDGVTGNAITRYLMRAADEVTGGRASQATMAVLISTAEVGGVLAAAYTRHRSALRQGRTHAR
jgi:pseudouridine-5'-phosphate glycosidase